MAASRAIGEAGDPPSLLVDRSTLGVLILVLNRPQVHNALDGCLIASLKRELQVAADDPEVRAIILTGAGTSFCSGDDLKALRTESHERFAETIEGLQSLTRYLFASSKPVIAALNGPAYGAGLELVLSCDVRIAAHSFVAATPEVRLGLVPTNAASVLLPLLVGQSHARAMMMGGMTKDAGWCLAAGLVDELVTSEALMRRAVAIAGEMAKGAPGALAAARRMMNAPLQAAIEAALRLESQLCIKARGTPECTEGIAAFFAGRSPEWTGG